MDRKAKLRAKVMRLYSDGRWSWHWPLSGELIVVRKATGEVVFCEKVD